MMILNTYYTQQVFIRTIIRVSEKYVINGYNSIHYKPLDPTWCQNNGTLIGEALMFRQQPRMPLPNAI